MKATLGSEKTTSQASHSRLLAPRLLAPLLVLLFIACVYSGWGLWRANQFNKAVLQGELGAAAQMISGPRLHFLRALVQDREGNLEGASEGYASLAGGDDEALWSTARFNLAGVYMRQAVALELEERQDGRAVLLELAKWHYRVLLRAKPSDLAAARNLAIVLALQPDVIARDPSDLDDMPERSPEAPIAAAGRERLP